MALPGIPPAPVGAKSDKAPKTLILSDFPAGGSIGVATDTVDRFEKINIAQTTADQILTLPNAEKNKIVYIQNTGTAAFTTNTIELQPGEFSLFVFSGTFWARPLQGQGGGNSIDTVYDGALLGTQSVTFTSAQMEGKTHFIISVKFYAHRTSVTVPIQDYLTSDYNALSIANAMGSWFDQNSRAEIGCIEASYNTQTRVFKVEQAFYRHSNAWGTKQIRNNHSGYFVSKIEVM